MRLKAMKLKVLLFVVVFCLVGSLSAQEPSIGPVKNSRVVNAPQACPTYPAADRKIIKSILSRQVILSDGVNEFPYSGGAQGMLIRMNEIAYLGSFDFVSFPTQRLAFREEYNFYLGAFSDLPSHLPSRLSPASQRFLATILSPAFLGIEGTNIYGATESEAIANSQAANTALTLALSRLWQCF